MTGDRHVRFCERRGVQLPPATHPSACHELTETPASREYQQRWPLRIFADR